MFNLTNLTTTFTVEEATAVGKPLLVFIAGIVVYAVFVFKFYRFLARRDILPLNLQQYSASFIQKLEKFFSFIFYIIEYIVFFPLLIFFWFAVVAGILTFLSKNPLADTLLISMALVASVRITAYYNEDLSRDLAKMMPFALLGVFLVDMSMFSIAESIEVLKQIPDQWVILVYYLGFIMAIELILRIINLIISPFRKEKTQEVVEDES